jgi:hypothetical protein
MADILISQLPEFTDFDQNDIVPVTDITTNITRKYTLGNILSGLATKISVFANGSQAVTQSTMDATTLIATDEFVHNVVTAGINGIVFPTIPTYNFAALQSPNGYQVLPSGVIIQWGWVPYGTATVNFPVAFNTVFSATMGQVGGGDTWDNNISGLSNSQISFAMDYRSNGSYYMAIGI